ncbi:hypothetical protein [Alkalibacillus salilacus]|uniref:DUF4179 domain-containing protein n=1 Tax=Alkalibacillus salilacus TaxID=284582 RepID=A0ABT9VGM0_9BACI|nr:hypothetical protein [Alkalibacillus salilacus]MDQ0160010.1 hypothetical protein [Alkalibacillus salilacus]
MGKKRDKYIGFIVVTGFIIAVLFITGTISTWVSGMQFVITKEDVKPYSNELDATFQTTFKEGLQIGELDKQLVLYDDLTLQLKNIKQGDDQITFTFESRGTYGSNSAEIISVADQGPDENTENFAKIKLISDESQVALEPKTNHGVNHRKGDQVTYKLPREEFEPFQSTATTLLMDDLYLTKWINFKQLFRGI